MKMSSLDTVTMILVVIGALNWGLWGLLGVNVVESLLGGLGEGLVKIVYILVGLSGLWMLYKWYGGKK